MNDEEQAFSYWPLIENYLPKYSSRDDVLHSDILTRYLDDEEVCDADLAWIEKLDAREEVVDALIDIDSVLLQESLEAYLRERYKAEVLKF